MSGARRVAGPTSGAPGGAPRVRSGPSRRSLAAAVVAALTLLGLIGFGGYVVLRPTLELPRQLEEALRRCGDPSDSQACRDAMRLPPGSDSPYAQRVLFAAPLPDLESFEGTHVCVLNDIADVRGIAHFRSSDVRVGGSFRRIEGEWVLLRLGRSSSVPRVCGVD